MNKLNIKLNSLKELKDYGYEIMDKENSLDNKIKELLESKGLSQSDLSKLTGISRQNISDIIQNKMKPGVDFAIKIAIILGVTVEDVFYLNQNAWYKIAKFEDGISIFVDLYELKIIDNRTKKEDLSNGALEYYYLSENECVDKNKYKELLNQYIKKHSNSDKTKKELIKDFEENICTNRYKKLIQRVTPITNIIDIYK